MRGARRPPFFFFNANPEAGTTMVPSTHTKWDFFSVFVSRVFFGVIA